MKSIPFYILILWSLFFVSCNSEPTLQKYFVENTENKNFLAIDLSPSILNLDKVKLTLVQKEALNSFEKMNILAYKLDGKNKAQYAIEKTKVKAILKDKKYQELMKFGSGNEGASISFVGDDEHIEEFVLYANKNENGFALVRILGEDMNPTAIMNMIFILQKADVNLEQLKPLEQLLMK